jgi:hypothetical protein
VSQSRLKDRIGYRLITTNGGGALTGSLPLFQKRLAGVVIYYLSKCFWFFGSSAMRLNRFQGLESSGLICRAMAQTKPESSRATAVTATWDFFLPTRVRWT